MRLALVVIVLMAGGDDESGSGPTETLTARAWFDGYAEAQCERSLRRGTSTTSVVDCLATYEAAAEPKRQRFVDAIADGSLGFSSAKVDECLSLMAGACGSDDVTRILPVCDDVLDGTPIGTPACP